MHIVKLTNRKSLRSIRVYMQEDEGGGWSASLSMKRWREIKKELECGNHPTSVFMERNGVFYHVSTMEMMPSHGIAPEHRRMHLLAIPLSPAHGQKKLRKTAG